MGRIFKVISLGLVLVELFSCVSSLPYSKYGRSCSDIGCLSSEVCVMAVDSCSYGQRENKECGRYPTCRKSGSAGGSTGPATSHSYPSNTPENTYPSRPSAPAAPAPEPPRPSYPTHGGGSSYPSGGGSSYPSSSGGGFNNINSGGYMPPSSGGGTSFGGGGSSYGGGGSSYGGGGSSYGGGGSSYGGGGYSPMTTKKPKSSSDSFGGFFSGLLSGGFGSLIQNALSNQGGSTSGTRGGSGGLSSLFGGGSTSGSSGGLGGLFDTRRLIENRNFGSLFNERTPSSGSSGSTQTSSRGAGYPTQPPYNGYAPSYTAGGSPTSGQTAGTSHQTGNTQYGWKLK